MAVIVTGATSFIGRAVVEELLKQGQKVYAVARPGSAGLSFLKALPLNGQEGRREGAVGSVRILECNLNEIERLKEMDITDASAWLHLGWEGAGSANRQDPALQAKNIGYALSAVRTAGALGCSRFLFSGSQAEYGICDSPMREDQPCHPVSEYGKDKVLVCRQAGELAGQLHMDYIHTRIFSVYGPGDHPWSLISTCIDTFLKGSNMEMGQCNKKWNLLYVTEAAELLVKLLLGKAPAGVYNVAGEDTRPLRDYIEELHRLCGSLGSYHFGDRPPNAEGMVSLMPELTKLKAAVGFTQQIPFSEGIRRMVQEKKGEI